MYLKNGFKHFITICKHKKAVWYFGRRLGIGWKAFFHDLSKFHPIEFFEGMKYYTGVRSPIDACKDHNMYSKAWLHHRARNPHHFEYWIDTEGKAIDMPRKYKLEMLADYLAAAYTYSRGKCTFNEEYTWWLRKSSNVLYMHKNTKEFLDKAFELMAQEFGTCRLTSLDQNHWNFIKNNLF